MTWKNELVPKLFERREDELFVAFTSGNRALLLTSLQASDEQRVLKLFFSPESMTPNEIIKVLDDYNIHILEEDSLIIKIITSESTSYAIREHSMLNSYLRKNLVQNYIPSNPNIALSNILKNGDERQKARLALGLTGASINVFNTMNQYHESNIALNSFSGASSDTAEYLINEEVLNDRFIGLESDNDAAWKATGSVSRGGNSNHSNMSQIATEFRSNASAGGYYYVGWHWGGQWGVNEGHYVQAATTSRVNLDNIKRIVVHGRVNNGGSNNGTMGRPIIGIDTMRNRATYQNIPYYTMRGSGSGGDFTLTLDVQEARGSYFILFRHQHTGNYYTNNAQNVWSWFQRVYFEYI
ncbi:hypothetical protein [Geomicrobium sp. JCM 19038]|uniref:hypothetical protein n=1 Tax=Geomicrobium sp. JCM 19038 TaxID=1460635 RepID=UPI00045F4B59|nr:hypothetical protein [Geomicrobium sp. JCM 19038]GAK09634.1 hypothetical protein JCM19038_3479 [Geomicrobium sp. JCM 19038]